ncbi:MAG: hypothetical protein AVDCRST_MAG26-316 [uncultured Chloroflexia bacterium]|uniref:Uncharacterized protein n=1 Tax=uncultured Chloroflexia bacterium TaxID=1672391 RepID=A0A6J4H699_9CHLR|nr:MAG: hypothetical protein AVDCRST_MAG26-316 [uncultured Chloroflexia bacterium]
MRARLSRYTVIFLILGGLVACGQAAEPAATTGGQVAEPAATTGGQVAEPAATVVVETAPDGTVGPRSEPGPAPSETAAVGISHGGSVQDHVTFIDHLRSTGLTVEIVGEVEQPFLLGTGTTLRISGGDLKQPAEIQSYTYDDTELERRSCILM